MIKIADCGWKATVGHVHDCVITAGQLSVSLGTYVSAHALKTSIYVTDLLNIAADPCLFAMFKTVSTVLQLHNSDQDCNHVPGPHNQH